MSHIVLSHQPKICNHDMLVMDFSSNTAPNPFQSASDLVPPCPCVSLLAIHPILTPAPPSHSRPFWAGKNSYRLNTELGWHCKWRPMAVLASLWRAEWNTASSPYNARRQCPSNISPVLNTSTLLLLDKMASSAHKAASSEGSSHYHMSIQSTPPGLPSGTTTPCEWGAQDS